MRLAVALALVSVFLVATGEVGRLVVARDDGGVEPRLPPLPPGGVGGGGESELENDLKAPARRTVEASESDWVRSVVIFGSDRV